MFKNVDVSVIHHGSMLAWFCPLMKTKKCDLQLVFHVFIVCFIFLIYSFTGTFAGFLTKPETVRNVTQRKTTQLFLFLISAAPVFTLPENEGMKDQEMTESWFTFWGRNVSVSSFFCLSPKWRLTTLQVICAVVWELCGLCGSVFGLLGAEAVVHISTTQSRPLHCRMKLMHQSQRHNTENFSVCLLLFSWFSLTSCFHRWFHPVYLLWWLKWALWLNKHGTDSCLIIKSHM